jgi:S-layer homology domain/IPT/TIG domain
MRRIVRVLGSVLLFAGAAAGAAAATYTVTAQGESGAGSIGQAITNANTNPGLDTIEFDIPGTPPFGVSIFMGIPSITDAVLIDGTTQPGYAGTPLFLIRSGLGQGPGLILTATAGGSTIRGLAFADINEGIRIEGDGNTIESCFFGTDVTGMADLGNTGMGINILSGDDNLIGGTAPAARNLISENDGYGVRVLGGSGNEIRGNLIGTKLNGTEALGNQVGVSITGGGSDNVVGGTAAGAGNLISGNTLGIELVGVTGTLVAGNRIGTDASGSVDIGNGSGILANTVGLVIGGTTAAARNIISGNGTGVLLGSGDDNLIAGNFIGTDAAGTEPLGNDSGVMVTSASVTDTQIGGEGPAEGNVIAFNGVGITNLGLRTAIRANSIHDNDALGIDHGNPGPTPNDGDFDAYQNFPILDSVEISASTVAGGSVRIVGSLESQNGDFTLDFFANPPCAENPQDFLEGETYLGSAPVTVAAGVGLFDVTFPVTVAPGARISATATNAAGSTSEFSQRLPFAVTPTTGPGSGGTMITVNGTNFENGLTAAIGGVPVTNLGPIFDVFFTGNAPALPGGIWDLTVTLPSGRTGTLPRAWTVDFADVPPSDPFFSFIQVLVQRGITAGVGGGSYGRNQSTLRQQMAVFLLKAIHGICYIPPACTGVFDDVACPSSFADWIEAFAAAGITGGCGGDLYCPTNPVRRDQMAVFLLKAKYGSGHIPPPCTGVFDDVACPSTFADWIEQLAAEEITGGCGGGDTYCPLTPTTRGQMAVFIVKTFDLQ